ncbi:MAG: hypothetical protein ACI3W7_01595 [Oscillospiraceae bacterium]
MITAQRAIAVIITPSRNLKKERFLTLAPQYGQSFAFFATHAPQVRQFVIFLFGALF